MRTMHHQSTDPVLILYDLVMSQTVKCVPLCPGQDDGVNALFYSKKLWRWWPEVRSITQPHNAHCHSECCARQIREINKQVLPHDCASLLADYHGNAMATAEAAASPGGLCTSSGRERLLSYLRLQTGLIRKRIFASN